MVYEKTHVYIALKNAGTLNCKMNRGETNIIDVKQHEKIQDKPTQGNQNATSTNEMKSLRSQDTLQQCKGLGKGVNRNTKTNEEALKCKPRPLLHHR